VTPGLERWARTSRFRPVLSNPTVQTGDRIVLTEDAFLRESPSRELPPTGKVVGLIKDGEPLRVLEMQNIRTRTGNVALWLKVRRLDR
jgi:hypothetical protein